MLQVLGVHHVCVRSEDPAATADLFGRVLGLPLTTGPNAAGPVFARAGQSSIEIIGTGPDAPFAPGRAGVNHLALAVADLKVAIAEARAAGLVMLNVEPVQGASGMMLANVDPRSTAGVSIQFVAAPLWPEHAATELVLDLDHAGLGTLDVGASERLFGLLGFVPDRRLERPGFVASFVNHAGADLELVYDEHKGTVGSYTAQHGPGLHHLALRVNSLERALQALGLGSNLQRPSARGKAMAFLPLAAGQGAQLQFVEA